MDAYIHSRLYSREAVTDKQTDRLIYRIDACWLEESSPKMNTFILNDLSK